MPCVPPAVTGWPAGAARPSVPRAPVSRADAGGGGSRSEPAHSPLAIGASLAVGTLPEHGHARWRLHPLTAAAAGLRPAGGRTHTAGGTRVSERSLQHPVHPH